MAQGSSTKHINATILYDMTFGPDNKYFVTVGSFGFEVFNADGTFGTFQRHSPFAATLLGCAFSPDGSLFAVCGTNHDPAQIFDAGT